MCDAVLFPKQLLKCQNETSCQKVVPAVDAVDVLHVAQWFRSSTYLYDVRSSICIKNFVAVRFESTRYFVIGVSFQFMNICNVFERLC